MYDAIVVGARCAGSATALLLARAGRRVLLLEKARFPRDTLSTLYIQQRGVARLRRWGLLGEVASACPALETMSYQIGDVRIEGRSRPIEGSTAAYAPRRYTVDTLLAEAAVAAGVEFRDGCTVDDLVWSDGRVVGVRLRGYGEERARLVVGADGMRSTVAERVDAAVLVEHPPQTCVYYTFWAGAADHFELYEAPGQWIGAVPTGEGRTLVQAYFPQSDFARVKTGAMEAYLGNVRTAAPGLYERMLEGGQDGRLRGTGDQRNFFRASAGPGWALAGDASHQRDSITALGITQAFLSAEALATRVTPVLDDCPRLDAALAEYARERYDAMLGDYHRTLSTARLAVPGHRVELLREIAGDPARVEDFFSAMSGETTTPAHDAESVSQAIRWMKARRASVAMNSTAM